MVTFGCCCPLPGIAAAGPPTQCTHAGSGPGVLLVAITSPPVLPSSSRTRTASCICLPSLRSLNVVSPAGIVSGSCSAYSWAAIVTTLVPNGAAVAAMGAASWFGVDRSQADGVSASAPTKNHGRRLSAITTSSRWRKGYGTGQHSARVIAQPSYSVAAVDIVLAALNLHAPVGHSYSGKF